jgi:hypothetical protein
MRRCDFCGGKFGLIVHRQWGRRFCKLACKTAHQSRPHENLQSRRQCDAPTMSGKLGYVLSLAVVFGTAISAITSRWLVRQGAPAFQLGPWLLSNRPCQSQGDGISAGRFSRRVLQIQLR